MSGNGKRRRANGEGSIFQRASDGLWVGRIDLGAVDGKPVRKTVYGRTQREALDKLKELRRKFDRGEPLTAKKYTVAEYLEHWVSEVLPGTVKPATLESYGYLVRKDLVPALGHHKLDKLTPQHVRSFLRSMEERTSNRGRPYSARTIRYLHAILRRALDQACREELIPRNVAKLVTPPRQDATEIQPLTPEEARQFLDVARRDRLGALYVLALTLGMRRGELLALRWSDIDLTAKTVMVRASLQRVGGELIFVQPKTAKSRRLLPLPPSCVTALKRHRTRQQKERESADVWEDETLVFTTSVGTPLDPRNFARQFEAIRKQADVRRVRFHDLRHTAASLMIQEGIEPRTVMDILGHSVIGTTLNIYVHLMPAVHRSATDALDALLKDEGGPTRKRGTRRRPRPDEPPTPPAPSAP